MNAVLYTHELEPITVVDIPISLWKRLYEGELIVLNAFSPPHLVAAIQAGQKGIEIHAPRRVEIFAEIIRIRKQETLLLFTSNEEDALALKSELLPGQRKDAQTRERTQYAAGFLRALQEFAG